MKILNCFKSAKAMMMRLSIIICLGLCLNFHSHCNPIIDPPMIIEIYFSSDDVFIELLISEYFGGTNLDNIRMTGLYDTAQFLPGITYTPGVVFYVTSADFQTPFYINRDGDYLLLEAFYNGYWHSFDHYGIKFGNLPWTEVSAPTGEESIAYQGFGDYPNETWWAVKELPNTIGASPFSVSKRAEFSGFVKDRNDEPLANIELYYCDDSYHYGYPAVPWVITDENGYFHASNMFCKKYYIDFLYEEGEIGDTIISVEPDSANYFEFKLDTLLTGIAEHHQEMTTYSISNIPNPFLNNTTFVVGSKYFKHYQKGVIKIYNPEGFIVDILPVEISGEKQEVNYKPDDKSLAAGVYYYSLEIGKEKKASGKMVISQ